MRRLFYAPIVILALALVALAAVVAPFLTAARDARPAAPAAPSDAQQGLYLPVVFGLQPTATPTVTLLPTATVPPAATLPPTITPTGTLPTATPTLSLPATPTLPPPSFNGCREDPNPAIAPNYPVLIVRVDKAAEVVTLRNVSTAPVSIEDWNMCSITGNQEHDQIFGSLAPGETRNFPNIGDGPIWSDTQRDDGALYNNAGSLVSYWVDQ